MDDNNNEKTEKKVNKKMARSAKNANSKGKNPKTKETTNTVAPKSALVNDGKCCRCSFRGKEKKCSCKRSSESGKYVARKHGCNCFKYSN